jgi:hypothetical protein
MIRKAIMLAIVGVFAVLAAGLGFGLVGNALAVSGADGPGINATTSKLGDNDNFGYGRGTGPPPCAFYDNREPEDLGVFDYELSGGDEVDTWTHTFAVTGTPVKITLTTWELFSDFEASTIDLDGTVLPYATAPFSTCTYPEGGLQRVHVLKGAAAAAIAADGVIVVTFSENGDDISLDRANLKVAFR